MINFYIYINLKKICYKFALIITRLKIHSNHSNQINCKIEKLPKIEKLFLFNIFLNKNNLKKKIKKNELYR